MKRRLSILVLLGAFGIGSQASAGPIPFGSENANQGVLCQFPEKGIEALTQNVKECLAIGGKPTHQLSTVRKPLPKYANKHR